MASMPGALPNMLPQSGLVRTSSHGTPSSAWMPPSSSYTSACPAQTPPYAQPMPPAPSIFMLLPTLSLIYFLFMLSQIKNKVTDQSLFYPLFTILICFIFMLIEFRFENLRGLRGAASCQQRATLWVTF